MARTSRLNQDNPAGSVFMYKDWFAAHGALSREKRSDGKRGEFGEFVKFLWPVGLDYASPLNPIFLGEHTGTQGGRSICLVRDGLVPLLWFFKSHPYPDDFARQLLVHKDLSAFVPNSWRKITGSYEPVSFAPNRTRLKATRTRKLLFGGIVMDTFCSLKHLREQLEWIKSKISRAELTKAEILLFLPPRLSGWGTEHLHDFHGEYMIALCKSLGTHVRAIDWRTLESIPTLEGFEWFEFNERLLCADSYLSHAVLKRGARLFGTPEISRASADVLNLSPYHGMRVKRRIGGRCVLEDSSKTGREVLLIKAQFEKAMQSEANNRFPLAELVPILGNGRAFDRAFVMVSLIVLAEARNLDVSPSLLAVRRAAEFARSHGIATEVLVVQTSPDPYLEKVLQPHADLFTSKFLQCSDRGSAINYAVSRANGEMISIIDTLDVLSAQWIHACHKTLSIAEPGEKLILHPEYLLCCKWPIGVHRIVNSGPMSTHPPTLAFRNAFTNLAFARKELFVSTPFPPDLNGVGHPEWSWNCEALAAGATHRVLKDCWHFRREGKDCLEESSAKPVLSPSRLFEGELRWQDLKSAGDLSQLIQDEAFQQQWLAFQGICEDWRDVPLSRLDFAQPDPRTNCEARLFMDCAKMLPDDLDYLVVIHWLKRGGAEKEALQWIGELKNCFPHYKIAVIGTENRSSEWAYKLPEGVTWLEYGILARDAGFESKRRVFLKLLLQKRPKVIHNVISNLCWDLFKTHSKVLKKNSKLLATLFCVDFSKDGSPNSYAYSHLPICHDDIEMIVTDNMNHAREIETFFDIRNVEVLYQPADMALVEPRAHPAATSLQVLWAGRFDFQKRIDVLYEIVKACPDFRFHIYGDFVADLPDDSFDKDDFKKLPNAVLYGAYNSFCEIPVENFDVFLYTSAWDGLPNVLLEAASRGLPVLAPDVGGVSEFLNEQNGFIVSGVENVDQYSANLRYIAENRENAVRRTLSAQEDLKTKFSDANYRANQRRLFQKLGLL